MKNGRYDESTTVFAYKLATGLAYTFTETVDMTLDYSYFATTDPVLANGWLQETFEYKSHNINLGFRINF
jgi:opacity protein-like surface antigen